MKRIEEAATRWPTSTGQSRAAAIVCTPSLRGTDKSRLNNGPGSLSQQYKSKQREAARFIVCRSDSHRVGEARHGEGPGYLPQSAASELFTSSLGFSPFPVITSPRSPLLPGLYLTRWTFSFFCFRFYFYFFKPLLLVVGARR